MKRTILIALSLLLLNIHPAFADAPLFSPAHPAAPGEASREAWEPERSEESKGQKQLTIIFDLGGVVLESKNAIQFIGIPKLLAYAMTQNPVALPQKLKTVLLEFLHEVHERHPHEVNAQDDQGNPLPQCMCNWMKGTHTPEQLREDVDLKLSMREKNIESSIIQAISHMMFTPELFSQTQDIVPETAELIKELKKQGYKLYILSNFCNISFDMIKERNPEFFALFDGIVISADAGFIKPDPNIYQHLLETHNIDPKSACFIDDLSINLEAARQFGLHTIHCPSKYGYFYGKSPDIATVRQGIESWQNSFQSTQSLAIT